MKVLMALALMTVLAAPALACERSHDDSAPKKKAEVVAPAEESIQQADVAAQAVPEVAEAVSAAEQDAAAPATDAE